MGPFHQGRRWLYLKSLGSSVHQTLLFAVTRNVRAIRSMWMGPGAGADTEQRLSASKCEENLACRQQLLTSETTTDFECLIYKVLGDTNNLESESVFYRYQYLI